MHKVNIYGMFFFSKGNFNIFVKIQIIYLYLPMKEITEVLHFWTIWKATFE